ncbi:MAG TPA: DNA replication and repair protein RecF [Candidatus Limnocylindrales bacterium]|nr:DNA replication and repair protein RecF [Candidatus Limnocylindrales bacterium]
MRVTRLLLEDFRSYPTAELHPDPRLTIVAGPNGAGKTNLLEAIHVAVAGRSHRAGADHELVRHGRPFARVRLDLSADLAAEPASDGARLELVLPGETGDPEIRKRLLLNGLPRRSSTVSEVVRTVLFRPEEMLLLVGSPGERRRFMDGILAQRDRRAARDLATLARVLAQRNALLRAIRREEAGEEGLAFWDEQLADVGARVMAARLRVVADLATRIPELHDAVAPAEERRDAVRLSYLDTLKDAWPERPAIDDMVGGALPTAELLLPAFRRRIADARQKELWNGVTLIGPQRDDLRVDLAERDVASHASRGQQRTIILAMKLAERDLLGEDGAPAPVVLLDDVFSELDPERSGRALELLLERGQVLVTTADLMALPPARRRGVPIWQVGEGRLTRAPRVA